MSVKVTDKFDIARRIREIDELGKKDVQIGIFNQKNRALAMIAYVNEYGAVITPKTSKYLAIPMTREMKGKSPRSIKNTFVATARDGGKYIARSNDRKQMEYLFALRKKVVIPKRSFIRAGFDANREKIDAFAADMAKNVYTGNITAAQYYERLGEYCAMRIKTYMTNLKKPENSSLTVRSKGSSNPLIDTGALQDAVTYRVI